MGFELQKNELENYLHRLEENIKGVETLEQARVMNKEINEVEKEILDLQNLLKEKETFTAEQKQNIWDRTRRLRFALPFVFTAILSFAPFFNETYVPENESRGKDIYKTTEKWMRATVKIFEDIEKYEKLSKRNKESSGGSKDNEDVVFIESIDTDGSFVEG